MSTAVADRAGTDDIRALLKGVDARRRATDVTMRTLITLAFVAAMVPLVSLIWSVVTRGVGRFNSGFLLYSMRNVFGGMNAGGAYHAIIGTLLITLWASIISVPLGILAAVYLVEYGTGRLAKAVTFLVDVMTGIPSIVAGLFAFALFTEIFGPTTHSGFVGAVALAVLMTPVVVRSTEEMLRIVPNDLREASYALGVPRWLTIIHVVLRTAVPGIATGVMLAIARVIGETAPLIIAVGVSDSINYDVFHGNMMTLPVFVYRQYANGLVPCRPGEANCITTINYDRAWTGALTLILLVMVLNLLARLVSKVFAPKGAR